MEDSQLGQIAFDAYKTSVGGKAYDNTSIPNWHDLKLEIQKGWVSAGRAVRIWIENTDYDSIENVEY